MKRKIDLVSTYIYENTRSKKQKNENQNKTFVFASQTFNYMIKDPLIDWIKFSEKHLSINKNKNEGFQNFIMKKGLEFEDKIVEYIDNNICPIIKVNKYFSDEACKKTFELMKVGTPIIYSGSLKCSDNTGGVVDLLVRSDYINKLSEEKIYSNFEKIIPGINLNGEFHYVVIDIKFTTLHLRADGKLLLNSGNFPAYKAQTWIYTKALGEIQGYLPKYSFILGRRFIYKQKDIIYSNNNCLSKLGIIDFENIDVDYKIQTKKAIEWIRDVKENGDKWTLYPPSRPELYPNMCVDSGIWNSQKEIIANKLGEITSIWYTGIKNRDIANKNNIFSWRNPLCSSEMLGINGVRSNTINQIIDINRQDIDKIRPKIIKNNINNWKIKTKEVFVDFETFSDIFDNFEDLPLQKKSNMIFMIGTGFIRNNKWCYRTFLANSATIEEEYRIMDEFNDFMKDLGYPKIYYWHAEQNFWQNAEHKQFDYWKNNTEIIDNISDNWKITNWIDLSNIFRTEPIVLKDCFNFSLKSIVKSMNKFNMIKTGFITDCKGGLDAMTKAFKCYKEGIINSFIMNDIIKYNETDCKVLCEILDYLRKNNCN